MTANDNPHIPYYNTSEAAWEHLAALDTEVHDLDAKVTAVKDDGKAPYFRANEIWRGYIPHTQGLKQQMRALAERDRRPFGRSAAWSS